MRLSHACSMLLSRGRSILLPAILMLSFVSRAGAAPFSPDAHTTLLMHFDGDALGAHSEQAVASAGVSYAAGKVGSAAWFPAGCDVRHERLGNLDGAQGTIEFWLKPNWNGGDGLSHTILECGQAGGMLVVKDGGGYLRLIANRYGPGSTSELGVSWNISSWSAGVWRHVAFTWSATEIRVYTDGVLRNTSVLSVAPPALTAEYVQFGAQGANDPLNGWLDDLRLSDLVRSASTIAADAGGAALANDSRTLLLLRFDGDVNGATGGQPLASAGITYEGGIYAQAGRLTSATDLRWWRQGHLSGPEGTIEFWLKPGWRGDDGLEHVLLASGMWGGMMVLKDGGNAWRIILNRWSPNGTPELGVGKDVSAWSADAWHHCAFTWSASRIEAWVDGVCVAQTTPAIPPPYLGELEFLLGNEGRRIAIDGLVDELRISDVARSAAEIQAAYIGGLAITQLYALPDTASLWTGWPLKVAFAAETQVGTVAVPTAAVSWSTSDAGVVSIASGAPRAAGGGAAIVTATLNGASAGVSVAVRAPVLAPTHETLPGDLVTPVEHAVWDVPVLVIRYFATSDGVNLDTSISPDFWDLGPLTLEQLDANVLAHNRRVKFVLEQGSRFRAYSNPHARASLGYHVVDQITVYEQTPPGKAIGDDGGHAIYEPDWFEIFERLNVRHYVEDLGVKEVWVWTGGLGAWPSFDPLVHAYDDFRGGWESNMSSPITGDISNSNRDGTDLPVYDRTYVVYGYNFRRSQAEAVHDHGHQIESQFAHVNWLQDGNSDLFWKRWRGQDENGTKVTGRCGDTHSPPNTLDDYDYENPALVESDIADWTPDHSGATALVNVDTWGALAFDWPDGDAGFSQRVETQWYLYWMMSMPGFANGLHDGADAITNWWRFVGDWDGSVTGGIGLHDTFEQVGVGAPGAGVEPLALSRVIPNPARHGAIVELRLGAAAMLTASVYDLQGRRVRTLCDGPAPAGAGRIAWDLRDDAGVRVAPGVYLLRAGVPGHALTRKLCVVR